MGYHVSVLLQQAVDWLNVNKGETYVDCTLGDGGYSLELIQRGGRVIGLDADTESLARATKRLQELGINEGCYNFHKLNFRDLDRVVSAPVAGFVYDLGVSSHQLDDASRGFSFSKDAELDMRMDQELGVKAADMVNALGRKELTLLFGKLGEFHNKRVIEAIIEHRNLKPFKTTRELAEVIEAVSGRVRGRIHAATLIFQALRIAVNDELHSLEESLPKAFDRIKTGGRIVVVSFHSLEDRIVKVKFGAWAELGLAKELVARPVEPSEEEIRKNPRSRSAKLRVIEKI